MEGVSEERVLNHPANLPQIRFGYWREIIVNMPIAIQLRKENTSTACIVDTIFSRSFFAVTFEKSTYVLNLDNLGMAAVQK